MVQQWLNCSFGINGPSARFSRWLWTQISMLIFVWKSIANTLSCRAWKDQKFVFFFIYQLKNLVRKLIKDKTGSERAPVTLPRESWPTFAKQSVRKSLLAWHNLACLIFYSFIIFCRFHRSWLICMLLYRILWHLGNAHWPLAAHLHTNMLICKTDSGSIFFLKKNVKSVMKI